MNTNENYTMANGLDNILLRGQKVGFIGAGNMTSTFIRRFIETKTLLPHQIFVSSRTQGKVQKLHDQYKINISLTNENLIESSDIVIIAVKPQDFQEAIEPVASIFKPQQIIVSLAAGLSLDFLVKLVRHGRWARVMPNTPSRLGQGVVGLCFKDKKDNGLNTLISDLLNPLGHIVNVEEGDPFDTILVSAASGTGFIFELMSYWQEWIEERGFTSEEARQITVETFLGSALLAQQNKNSSFTDLVTAVASKKGVTAAGLDSMRETEIERALRISFEKAWIRNQELAKIK